MDGSDTQSTQEKGRGYISMGKYVKEIESLT